MLRFILAQMNLGLVLAMCGLVVGCYAALILFQRWISKHIANRKKHPCTDEMVTGKECDKVQEKNAMAEENNKAEHKRLEDCIEGAEARTGKKYDDLKADIHREFDEVKELIRG